MCVAVACPTLEAPDPVRTLVDVSALEKPEVVNIWEASSITFWEVEFVMRSRNSGMFQDSAIQLVFEPQGAERMTINLLEAYENCGVVTPCATDPNARARSSQRCRRRSIDPCYPTDDFEAYRQIVFVDGSSVPSRLELVPVITISAGSAHLRNVTVRFYQNPLGLSCEDLITVDPCTACTDVTVLFVPSGGQTVIDGRTSRAQTICLGGDVDVPALYGPGGRTFSWPSFSCGYGLCVEASAAVGADVEASVTVELYTRWEAA